MRQVISHCNKGRYTQGSIFYGLESSAGNQCYGVIITARCDLEHQKVNKIVCLPIYKITDWMLLYGDQEIYEKSINSVMHQLDNLLKKNDLDSEKYKVFGFSEILKSLKLKGVDEKTIDVLSVCSRFIDKRDVRVNLKVVRDNNNKYLDSLLNHTKSNVYFIEGLLGDNSEAFVIDLGEPVSLPAQVLKSIDRTLHFQKFNRNKDTLYKNMCVREGESSEFVSTVNSPYIEHILQRFAQFYSRIGTEDIHENTTLIIRDIYEKR